jgi:hypothetical protein
VGVRGGEGVGNLGGDSVHFVADFGQLEDQYALLHKSAPESFVVCVLLNLWFEVMRRTNGIGEFDPGVL